MLVGEILKSVTGDDGYPGDVGPSEHWPGIAPGTRGILNALSPKYCNWAGIVDLAPKPPILWTHGAQDIVVADGSPWELGTLGSLGVVPGWPGADAFPPQPMVAQIRAVLSEYAARGGRVQMEWFEESGHFPPLDARERWNARLLRLPGVRLTSYAVPGLVMVDHELEVPLDHADPLGEQITIFAREVAEPEGRSKPFLVYLQGGPGFEAPRPTGSPRGPSWLDRALQEFRVLMLDQRGTGRSTPVGGDEPAEYLKHFRADSIVRDAELLRAALGLAALERARAELRRAVRVLVSLVRARRPARGVRDRRRAGDRRADRRRLPGHVGADDRAQPPLLRALPGRPRARAGAAAAPRPPRRAAPERRPADVAPAAHARQQAGDERGRGDPALPARAAARVARVPARRRRRAG